MSKSQRIGRAVETPVAPITVEPVIAPAVSAVVVAFVPAPLSPMTAAQVGKGFADAVNLDLKAKATFMASCLTTARLIGVPITASQWNKQIAPSVREAFAAKAKASRKDASSFTSELSRIKTFALAVNTGMADFQPVAGETVPAFLKRVSKSLETATHTDGRKVWDTPKAGKPAAPATPGNVAGSGVTTSKGSTDDDEGGFNARPMLAAALILTRGNASRAGQLAIACESYADDLGKWLDGILTEADKAELTAKVS